MRVNSVKYSEEKMNKAFKKRIDELILTMPSEVKCKNAENLLEAQTIVLPQIPNENKTREIANTLNHIESLLFELDFYEREKRKQYYVDLIEALSDEIDEEKIDVEDLKDRVLFGNTFNNTALILERKEKYNNLIKSGYYKTSFSNKNTTNFQNKDSKNSGKNRNFLGVKRRKMINSTGVRIINSLYSLSSLSITKKNMTSNSFNQSKYEEEGKNENDYFKLNENNGNSGYANEKTKSPVKQGNYKKQKLIKRGSTANLESKELDNNFSLDSQFYPYLTKNKNIAENTSNAVSKRCFKCFNMINLDNLVTCSVCNTNYHSYCENIKVVKVTEDSVQSISADPIVSERKICNYCIYVTQQSNIESDVKMNNANISNIINSNLDYENVEIISPIKESQIPNIKYKCQRLEDGIIKFNSQYGMNNYLFLKYSRELAKEYYLKSIKKE